MVEKIIQVIKKNIIYLAYTIVIFAFTLYSYCLMDPNFTLFTHPAWTVFRNMVIHIGYYQRTISISIYVILCILLFILQYIVLKKHKAISLTLLSILIGSIVVFSYPFLSHDLFNYLFSGKILVFYHKNPYLFKPLDFPDDNWLRFMHWTHSTYVYGPLFLFFPILSSLFAFGKFIISYFLYKAITIALFILSLLLLGKKNKQAALFLLTSPFIIIEGVINNHNDIIAIALVLFGIVHLINKKILLGKIFLCMSVGIKYFTLPYLFVSLKKRSMVNFCIIVLYTASLFALGIWKTLQPWYLLNLFPLVLIYREAKQYVTLLSIGFLLSYFPYIATDGWAGPGNVQIQKTIILTTILITTIKIIFDFRIKIYNIYKNNAISNK